MQLSYSTRILWATTLCLIVIYAVRLRHLEVFPIFLDETIHIYTAERILETGPFFNVQIGRLFVMWWLVPFQVIASDPVFVARTAILLTVLPGVAAAMGIAKLLIHRRLMIPVGVVYMVSAYHFFFDRLALVDPASASMTMLASYFATRLKIRFRYADALLCGLCLFIAVGAKISVLPYLGIPLAAAITLYRTPITIASIRRQLPQNILWLIVSMMTALIPLFILNILIMWRGYSLFGISLSYASSNLTNFNADVTFDLERIAGNAIQMLDIMTDYQGVVVMIVFALMCVVLLWKRRFFLLLLLFAPAFSQWISLPQFSRYWHVSATLSLLIILIGTGLLLEKIRWRSVSYIAYPIIFMLFLPGWLPIYQAIPDSNTVSWEQILPASEYNQYIRADAAGTGLEAVLDYLAPRSPDGIIGLLANCEGLRYRAMSRDMMVLCRTVNVDGSAIPEMIDWLNDSREASMYVVLENSPYVPDTSPGTLLTTISRPGNLVHLQIYDLSPD